MSRGIAYTREMRNKHIARKKRICRAIYGGSSHKLNESPTPGFWYKVDGRYSKGKIHCSCKMCTYSKYYDLPRISDMREKELVANALKDYYEA